MAILARPNVVQRQSRRPHFQSDTDGYASRNITPPLPPGFSVSVDFKRTLSPLNLYVFILNIVTGVFFVSVHSKAAYRCACCVMRHTSAAQNQGIGERDAIRADGARPDVVRSVHESD